MEVVHVGTHTLIADRREWYANVFVFGMLAHCVPRRGEGVECGVAASCGWSRRVPDASRRVEHGRLRVVYGHDHRAPRKTHFASRQRSRPVFPFPRLRRRGDLLRPPRIRAFSIAVSFSGSSGCCSTKWHPHSSRRAGRWW